MARPGRGGPRGPARREATDASSGETANVLPDVPEGAGYTIEIVARDGGEQGYSAPFTVGQEPQGAAAPAAF
ncbi:hypothetical protein [Streptomyces sp. NPDC057889]|uniref:hypothetical protein n=1 Tax=unclassified Streptomyces TaxID=2593676 RepID=UPI0036C1089A